MFSFRMMYRARKGFDILFSEFLGNRCCLPHLTKPSEMKRFMMLYPVLFCNSTSTPATVGNKFCYVGGLDGLEETYYLQSLHHALDQGFTLDDLSASDLASVSERFILKGLNIQYLHKYNVRISSDFTTLMFPFDSLEKEFAALQTVTHKRDVVVERISQNLSSKSDLPVLFGWSLVGRNQRELVVTSDPLDAIVVNQESDLSAISLPHNFTKFSLDVLSVLKPFKKIIFWLKPNLHDWETHKLLGSYFQKSAFFIRSNDFLPPVSSIQNGLSIRHVLMQAYPLYDEALETFDSYVEILHEQFKGHEKNSGLKWKRFSPLNELLKGHRKGELTIFSGQTGTGKTTFMSEYSLDLCTQGLPTLWASFEISNTRLLKTMLCQYSQCSLAENIDDYEHWSNEFKKLPMFFLNCHNLGNLGRILKVMTNAVIVYNVQHVVVDNLQFMMNMDDHNSTIDHFRRQDQIYSAFREFATRWNCHITLVIHPRKEPDYTELSNISISGTAKATQEADNVLILQTTKSRQYLQVTKNRFDGQKGCVVLEFNRTNQTFTVKKMSSKSKEKEQQSVIL